MVMKTENPESKNPSDRQRWDLRYREGAHAQRYWPSAYLQQLHQDGVIPDDGRALDMACGPVVTVVLGIPWSCGGCS